MVPTHHVGTQVGGGGGGAGAVPKLELGNQVDITFLSVNKPRGGSCFSTTTRIVDPLGKLPQAAIIKAGWGFELP